MDCKINKKEKRGRKIFLQAFQFNQVPDFVRDRPRESVALDTPAAHKSYREPTETKLKKIKKLQIIRVRTDFLIW